MQTAIVHNGLGPIEIDIRMTAQLLQRQLVHVQLLGMRVLNDEILLGVLREIRYLVQLVHADVAAQALSP